MEPERGWNLLMSHLPAVLRTISKTTMVRNSALPDIRVNPETFAVTVNGKHATVEPAKSIPLSQLYFFS